ncbi:MAG: PorT family protein [Bacteroidetes bacterium]|nr:MAG: PorT family protein [Bacteroidota bacterium]
MKNLFMKKLFVPLTVVMSLCFLGTQAQKSSDAGVSFGIRAGVNFQNITGKDNDGNKLDYKMKTGFHVGLNAEIPITEQLFFQPGLLFSTKGAKYNNDGTGSINLSYLELPLNVIYKHPVGSGHLLVGVGPYLAYGIGGKLKYSNTGTEIDKDITFKNSVSPTDYIANFGAYFKPLDYGLNTLVGYEFSENLSVQLNGQFGFANNIPDIEGFTTDAKAKNTGFGISFGYRF